MSNPSKPNFDDQLWDLLGKPLPEETTAEAYLNKLFERENIKTVGELIEKLKTNETFFTQGKGREFVGKRGLGVMIVILNPYGITPEDIGVSPEYLKTIADVMIISPREIQMSQAFETIMTGMGKPLPRRASRGKPEGGASVGRS